MSGARLAVATAASVAAACAVLLCPSPAAAQAVPDASCPGPGEGSNDATGHERQAQTFTAHNTGALTTAQIGEVDKGVSPGDFIVSINSVDSSGTPTNTVLAAAMVPAASVPAGPSTVTADFAVPPAVTAGQQYALVITRPTSASFDLGFRIPGPCPGDLYSSPDQTSPFTLYCAPDPCDMIFTVFVQPPKADRTLTFDVSKAKIRKGKKVQSSGQLEAAGNDPACEASQTIEILRDGLKRGAPQVVATLITDAQGGFATKLKLRKTSLLSARTPETGACNAGSSDIEKVRVKKKATKKA